MKHRYVINEYTEEVFIIAPVTVAGVVKILTNIKDVNIQDFKVYVIATPPVPTTETQQIPMPFNVMGEA